MKEPASDSEVAPAVQLPPHTGAAPSSTLDPDVQQIVDICTTLSPKDRSRLLKMCKSFHTDVRFDCVGGYISRYVPSIKRFRFMDLPVELRIHVAKYALTSDEPLSFCWRVTKDSTKIVGTFKGLEQLTAITRVSKQLHAELSDIVWTVNTSFQFGNRMTFVGRTAPEFFGPGRNKLLEKALELFSTKKCFRISQGLSVHVLYSMSSMSNSQDLRKIDEMISPLAQQNPYTDWKASLTSWIIHDHRIIRSRQIQKVADTGRALASALAAFDATGAKRQWKLFPRVDYNAQAQIRQKLIDAGIQEAGNWFDNGL